MKTKLIYLVSFLVTLSLLLSACQPTPAPAPTTAEPQSPPAGEAPQPDSGPPRGGTIVLIIPEEPTVLNRYLSDAAINWQVGDATATTGLTVVDENGEFQPMLAQELPTIENGGLSEDHTTVTWKLKPGLKWSDGQPLTSDDIKFTWEAISHPESGALLVSGFTSIESIETPDELTAIVQYAAPNVAYLSQFTFGLLPRHATGTPETMTAWEWNRKPVGAGPFVVAEWIAGDSIVMERNPYYFDEGKPYLDKLVFKVIPEPAAQTAMMAQGDAHVHLWPSETTPDYLKIAGEKAVLDIVPGIWNLAIDFNLSKPGDNDPTAASPHPILGDIRVRQAISHAIDYQTMVTDVVKETTISTNPFAYGWYECDIPRKYDFDPESAKKLLEEAGWVVGADGIRVAKGALHANDGTRLSLDLMGYTNFAPLQRAEEFIVENLKAVGIEARIQNVDFSIIFGSFSDGAPSKVGDFDMTFYDRGIDIEPSDEVRDRYHSESIASADNPYGNNDKRWVNPEVDALIDQAENTFDQEERRQAYCKIGEMMVEELPELYIFLFVDGYGFSKKLNGYTVSTWGSMTWDVQNWYMTP